MWPREIVRTNHGIEIIHGDSTVQRASESMKHIRKWKEATELRLLVEDNLKLTGAECAYVSWIGEAVQQTMRVNRKFIGSLLLGKTSPHAPTSSTTHSEHPIHSISRVRNNEIVGSSAQYDDKYS